MQKNFSIRPSQYFLVLFGKEMIFGKQQYLSQRMNRCMDLQVKKVKLRQKLY